MSLDKFGRQKKISQEKRIQCLEDELRTLRSIFDELWLQVIIMQEDLKKTPQIKGVNPK